VSPARQIVSTISPATNAGFIPNGLAATNVGFIPNGVEGYRPDLGSMTLQQNRTLANIPGYRASLDYPVPNAPGNPLQGTRVLSRTVYGSPSPTTPLMPAGALQANSSTTPLMPAGALQANPAQIVNPGAVSSLPGYMQKLGFGGANAAGTTGFQRFLSSSLTPGKYGGYAGAAAKRLGAYALPAQLAATYIVDPLNIGGANSAVDRFGTGAMAGAGIGAGIGSILPIGITTAAGAGIGALVGGGFNTIRGWFDDRSKTDLSKKNQKLIDGLNPLMERAGLTDSQGAQYKTQFDTNLQIMREQGTDTPDNVSQLIKDTQAQISRTAGSNAGKFTSKDIVALQAAIGQYMQPLIQQQQVSGDVAAQLYNDMANNMGSSAMANLVRGQAAGYKAQADALSAAYMGAAQNLPASYGLQQMAQLANQQQSTQSADLMAQITAAQQ
jgi:hypothetical protein